MGGGGPAGGTLTPSGVREATHPGSRSVPGSAGSWTTYSIGVEHLGPSPTRATVTATPVPGMNMMAALTIETIAQRVERVFARYREVDAAFLFGSRSVGRAREDSDIDLALVGCAEAIEPRRLDILTDLARAGLDEVDLVLLDGAASAPTYTIPASSSLLSVYSPTFGISLVISSDPSFVSRATQVNSSI